MKTFIISLLLFSVVYSQDFNSDGIIDGSELLRYDINGDGLVNNFDIEHSMPFSNTPLHPSGSENLNFISLWESPPGAFTNCLDGLIGYFDNDTLLDIAGFTYSPAKFYIYEQSPTNPGSFSQVKEFIKAEGGSYGPITAADTDGDGKTELITADVSGIARIYIYENDGNNNYVAQPSLTHPSNSEGGQGIHVGDMNKNGRKEIILLRGDSGGGEVRIWEHTGVIGTNSYTNIYTYTTVSYIFGKGGFGDSDNDNWDEVLIGLGGIPVYNTYIRRIEYDSASSAFQYSIFQAPSIGIPAFYKVYDLGNDGIKELLMTGNSNSRAAFYIFRSNGVNSYDKIDSIFESSDNNNMLGLDIKVLMGNSQPTIIMGSFNGRVYTYQYNGSSFSKDYENLNYPGPAIRRVYWLPVQTYDGYFNTWSSFNNNGTFYVFKRDITTGIENQHAALEYGLYQNYPNPFNPETRIKYVLNSSSQVRLSVFDLKGSLVKVLRDKRQNAGTYEVDFDGADLTSGVYFYRLETENRTLTGKMVLIK